jgi:hypothetical protein
MTQSILIALVLIAAVFAVAFLVLAALALRDPQAARHRVERLFRRPPSPPKAPGADHYYRPYWS